MFRSRRRRRPQRRVPITTSQTVSRDHVQFHPRLTAAGDFALLDTVAPGAVYTAGHVADNAAGFTAPTLPTSSVSTGVLTKPVWATGGGNITITAGRDIIGIETPTDPGDAYSTNFSSAGVSTGQFWSQWYYVNGNSTGSATAPFDPSAGGVQSSSWINYGTFFQGFGALGGGNITLKAGRNVQDVSASLPETIQVSGGQSANGPAATAHYYGGGNLLVDAGNDVLSGVYYVGRGTGLIRAGGKMVSDTTLYQSQLHMQRRAHHHRSPIRGTRQPSSRCRCCWQCRTAISMCRRRARSTLAASISRPAYVST